MRQSTAIVGRFAQVARWIGVGQWPLIGPVIRRAGRAINQWVSREGLMVVVDGQVAIRMSPLAFSGGAFVFDPKLTGELKNLAKPGRDFIDAGAHIGVASLVYSSLAGPDTRVIAFEPNPNVYPLLVDNSRVNSTRVECFQLALGESVGEVSFFVSGMDANASLSSDAPAKYWYWKDHQPPAMKECVVPMTTIDHISSALGVAPGVIKLDVEGAELHVLKGARETIKRCQPIILMETHVFAWESFGYRREDLSALIESLGYTVSDCNGDPFGGPLGTGPEPDNNHYLLLPK